MIGRVVATSVEGELLDEVLVLTRQEDAEFVTEVVEQIFRANRTKGVMVTMIPIGIESGVATLPINIGESTASTSELNEEILNLFKTVVDSTAVTAGLYLLLYLVKGGFIFRAYEPSTYTCYPSSIYGSVTADEVTPGMIRGAVLSMLSGTHWVSEELGS